VTEWSFLIHVSIKYSTLADLPYIEIGPSRRLVLVCCSLQRPHIRESRVIASAGSLVEAVV
jgi:hypothetical protein